MLGWRSQLRRRLLRPPPTLCLGTVALPGTYSACRGPSPQTSTRGLPQPRPRAAREQRSSLCLLRPPPPCPPLAQKDQGPEGAQEQKQPPPFCRHCENPLPPPPTGLLAALQCSPILKMGRLSERAEDLAATQLGFEPT